MISPPPLTSPRFLRLDRQVPWSLGLAFSIFLLYLIVFPFTAESVVYLFEERLPVFEEPPVAVDFQNAEKESSSDDATENGPETDSVFQPDQVAMQHPLARLLIRSYSTPYFALVVALFFITVVCAAPLTEEFVFRVVLQGTSQDLLGVDEKQPDPDNPSTPLSTLELSSEEKLQFEKTSSSTARSRRVRVCAAILFPAILFALLHVTSPDNPESPTPLNELFQALVSSGIANLLTFVVGTLLLIRFAGATSRDLGIPESFSFQGAVSFLQSWGQGVLLMILGAPFIIGLNKAAESLFPDVIVAPIPIFFFALYLGYVYYRIRKFAVVLGMHMTLNFISFATLMALVLR